MFTIKSSRQMVVHEIEARKIAHSVGLDFARYKAARAEIQRVSTFEGFREEPPTEIEIALGFFAFVLWTFKGTELRDPAFGEMANETARIVSVNFISALTNAPGVISSILEKVPEFDARREVTLAIAKDNSAAWKPCLTRAVIMVCRSLAYEATGIMGGQLELPPNMNLKEMGLVSYCLLSEALDEKTAAKIVAPVGVM